MEDVELVRRLRRRGRLAALPIGAISSPRNWERDGIVRRTLRNWRTYLRYRGGTAAEKVGSMYRGERRAIVVFCKEPVPGKVKTRLAADVGEEQAADLYKKLVRRTLAEAGRCRRAATVFVFYDPPGARARMISWLGPACRYVAQCPGDLGARMLDAFEAVHQRGFSEVVLVGSDCPALRAPLLDRAFALLRGHDVVLGPTEDGGYYLIAAKQPQPALFQDMAWSTSKVLDHTRAAAAAAGLRCKLLPRLRDLDHVEDMAYHQAAGHL